MLFAVPIRHLFRSKNENQKNTLVDTYCGFALDVLRLGLGHLRSTRGHTGAAPFRRTVARLFRNDLRQCGSVGFSLFSNDFGWIQRGMASLCDALPDHRCRFSFDGGPTGVQFSCPTLLFSPFPSLLRDILFSWPDWIAVCGAFSGHIQNEEHGE